ncbi:hypothetical protein FOZ63_009588 [Perkinsus olseni]|uniref:Uncharacterized protein n=1 Tax=Perkinsus olseni TaxID=32597 RepID=A0A7J6PWU0_PEROL|nr:hypothetical protein FOZ63_009588 [Perkinsus olseni]
MLSHRILLLLTVNVGRVLSEKFWGTYCHSEKLFPYPEQPFELFCVDLSPRDERQTSHAGPMPYEVDVNATFRYKSRDQTESTLREVPMSWTTEHVPGFTVYKIYVDFYAPQNRTELHEWLSKTGKLLGLRGRLFARSLRLYPVCSSTEPVKCRVTMAIGKYRFVLERVKPWVPKKPERRNKKLPKLALDSIPFMDRIPERVNVGSYKTFGYPRNCLSTKVQIREVNGTLEAEFSFGILGGGSKDIGWVKLTGDGALKGDRGAMTSAEVMGFSAKVTLLQKDTHIPDLTLDTIVIEPDGENQILLLLGKARDGSPAETVKLPRLS